MTVWTRYLAKSLYGATGFVLLAFLALFALFDFINELDDLGRGQYRLQHALIYVASGMPALAYELMPIAALIGCVYGLTQLAASSEMTAIRAAGWSPAKGWWSLVGLALPLVLATFLLGEYLAPQAVQFGQQVRSGSIGMALAREFRSGVWVRDTVRDAEGRVQSMAFFNARQLTQGQQLNDVRLLMFDGSNRLQSIYTAHTAAPEADGGWRFDQVVQTEFVRSQLPGAEAAMQVQIHQFPTWRWATSIGPDFLAAMTLEPAKMSLSSLYHYNRHLSENRQKADRYALAFWKKVFYPLAIPVMMALALPFGFLQVRAGGVGFKVFIGILLGVAFHFSNSLVAHLGVLNTWPPFWAALIPSLTALVFGLGLLYRVSR